MKKCKTCKKTLTKKIGYWTYQDYRTKENFYLCDKCDNDRIASDMGSYGYFDELMYKENQK